MERRRRDEEIGCHRRYGRFAVQHPRLGSDLFAVGRIAASKGVPAWGYYDPGGTQHALSVGLSAGSVPALIGTGALGVKWWFC
jgi:hypothetical protein